MHYLIYRIKESNGFIARRCFRQASYVCMIVYGFVAVQDMRIITPEMMVEG